MQHTHVHRVLRLFSKGQEGKLQNPIMNHFWEKVQSPVSILISTSFGAADDRNSSTVHISIPCKAIGTGEVLQLPECRHLHIAYHPYVNDLLGADLALQVGLALERR